MNYQMLGYSGGIQTSYSTPLFPASSSGLYTGSTLAVDPALTVNKYATGGLSLTQDPSSALSFAAAGITTGISTAGNLLNSYLGLQTAKVNAKSAVDVANINAQIQGLAASAGMSVAQLQEQAEAAKRKQMLWLGIAGIGVAGIIAVSAIFS